MPPARPALKPGLRLLRRDRTTLQVGLTPGAAVVVEGFDDSDRRVLDLLDGSRDAADVVRAAAAAGVDPARATEVLDLLRRAGALDDGPSAAGAVVDRLRPDAFALSLRHSGAGAAARALARRAETAVTVYGGGRVGATVAGLLAAAGVGAVAVVDNGPIRAADLAPGGIRRIRAGSRGEAATGAAAASAAVTSAPGSITRRLDVVAPVGFAAAPEVLAAVRRRTHLFVAVRETTAVVGPLVVPGHTPCLRCLELGRGERDPAWPRLAAQLVGEPPTVDPCDVVVATLAAGLAAAQLLAYVDGIERPATLGGVLELRGRSGERRRAGAATVCFVTSGMWLLREPGDGHNGGVSDIPRWAFSRGAKLASLPLGVAGRATVGLGKRIGGRPAEIVASELQARTAEQLFRVLGELKGGAMKFGQALSVFEAALPEDLAAPYRAALTKLQDSAPPMPPGTVHKVVAAGLGADWRDHFREFADRPAAAASIGQVHRARWNDGREVAVKLQYPGAGPALLSDLNQLARLARLFAVINPGLDVKPLIAELKARVAEELDYSLEAGSQAAFAAAYDGDPDIFVPKVVMSSEGVLVTEWIDGTPLSAIIAKGSEDERNRAGLLLVRFLFSGPARAGLLHADPHPGNFRLTADGRLAVLDYGAVNRLPHGLPAPIGPLVRAALAGDGEGVLAGFRAENFVRPEFEVDAQAVLDYLMPLLEPIRSETFRFSRAWLRREAARVADPRSPANHLGRQLNLPPTYLLIHRVTLGGIGVLCQLGAEAPYRAEMERWVPGFAS